MLEYAYIFVYTVNAIMKHIAIIKTNNFRSFLHIRVLDVHVRSEVNPKHRAHLTALYLRGLLRCVLNDGESFVLIIVKSESKLQRYGNQLYRRIGL
jgi:hypothetical protein